MAEGNERGSWLHNFTLPELNWGGGQRSLRSKRIKPNSDHSGFSSDSLFSTGRSPMPVNEMVESPVVNSSHPVSEIDEEVMEDIEDAADRLQISMEEKTEKKNSKKKGKEKVQLHKSQSVPQIPWNLRSRRATQVNGGGGDERGINGNVVSTGNRPKFSYTLTKEEIESDFIAMTGAKPPRRPKKRPKAVQRKLNELTPGMWLSYVKPENCEVIDNPKPGKSRKGRK